MQTWHMRPPTKLPKELDLPLAFELTRKLVAAGAGPETAAPVAELPEESTYQSVRRLALAEGIAASPTAKPISPPTRPQGSALRYWLWRLTGRPAAEPDELTEFRQRDHERALARERERVGELARLTETLQRAHEAEAERLRATTIQAEADAVVLRHRVAELEQAAQASRRAHEVELARLHEGHGGAMANALAEAAKARGDEITPLRWDLDQARTRIAQLEAELAQRDEALKREAAKAARSNGPSREELAEAAARASAAEERARLAENKVELLKDALDIAKSRAGAAIATDTRFREAKRAFARAFHPDQGGRDAPEKQRIFLDFWPELERIERES